MARDTARRLLHLDERRPTELNSVGRASNSAHAVTEDDDGTPAEHSNDSCLARLSRFEIEGLFERDSTERLDATVVADPVAAAVRLACLALCQAGLWGRSYGDVQMDHPRFDEAVAAAAAASDEKQALAAAIAILGGPEALKAPGWASAP